MWVELAQHAAERGLLYISDSIKPPVAVKEENRRLVGRSHRAARDLHLGRCVKAGDMILLRRAEGLPPAFSVVGRTVRLVKVGRPLATKDLAG